MAALYLDDILTMIKQSGWRIVSPDQAFNDTSWREEIINGTSTLWLKKPESLDCTFIDNLIEQATIFS